MYIGYIGLIVFCTPELSLRNVSFLKCLNEVITVSIIIY